MSVQRSAHREFPPTIEVVELNEYKRRVDDRIRVVAEDPIEVVSVTVTLRLASTGSIGTPAATARRRCNPPEACS